MVDTCMVRQNVRHSKVGPPAVWASLTLGCGHGLSVEDEAASTAYLKMMKKVLYGAHSNVAMGLGWRTAGCVTML